MLQFSTAHLPVCETYLQLAACEDCIRHIVSSLGVRKSNWNTAEHVRVAKSQCIFVARL